MRGLGKFVSVDSAGCVVAGSGAVWGVPAGEAYVLFGKRWLTSRLRSI